MKTNNASYSPGIVGATTAAFEAERMKLRLAVGVAIVTEYFHLRSSGSFAEMCGGGRADWVAQGCGARRDLPIPELVWHGRL